MIGRILMLTALAFAASAGVFAEVEPVRASDCAVCHEDTVAAYAAAPHGWAMAKRSAEQFELSCEACHGSGLTHIDELTAESIVGAPDSIACRSCHADRTARTERITPAHDRHGVDCLQCHDSGHGATEEDYLLVRGSRELCSSCHLEQRAQFQLPFAHRDGQQPFDCVTCHSLHGDNRVGRLGLAPESAACVDCHTDVARPFVFPHPPSGHAGCMACHTPHGTPNPRQLTRRNVTTLCLECHSDVPAFHDFSNPRYRACQDCHSASHGSNRDPSLFQE